MLRFLKPLANHSQFEKVAMEIQKDDIVQLFGEFLMGKCPNVIEFFSRSEENNV